MLLIKAKVSLWMNMWRIEHLRKVADGRLSSLWHKNVEGISNRVSIMVEKVKTFRVIEG